MDNGRFQKTSIPYHSHLFGIPRAKGGGGGGPLNWESEGMGDTYCTIGIPKAWGGGGYIWNFHREQTSSYTLKMLILWILKSVRK